LLALPKSPDGFDSSLSGFKIPESGGLSCTQLEAVSTITYSTAAECVKLSLLQGYCCPKCFLCGSREADLGMVNPSSIIEPETAMTCRGMAHFYNFLSYSVGGNCPSDVAYLDTSGFGVRIRPEVEGACCMDAAKAAALPDEYTLTYQPVLETAAPTKVVERTSLTEKNNESLTPVNVPTSAPILEQLRTSSTHETGFTESSNNESDVPCNLCKQGLVSRNAVANLHGNQINCLEAFNLMTNNFKERSTSCITTQNSLSHSCCTKDEEAAEITSEDISEDEGSGSTPVGGKATDDLNKNDVNSPSFEDPQSKNVLKSTGAHHDNNSGEGDNATDDRRNKDDENPPSFKDPQSKILHESTRATNDNSWVEEGNVEPGWILYWKNSSTQPKLSTYNVIAMFAIFCLWYQC